MTKDKAQKQAVRARMAKTGERYSTARHYLLDLHHQEQANSDVDAAAVGDEVLGSIAVFHSPADGVGDPATLVRDAVPTTAETARPPRAAEPGVSDAAVQRAT